MRLRISPLLALVLAASACASDGARTQTSVERPLVTEPAAPPVAVEPPRLKEPPPPTRGALEVRIDRAGLDASARISVDVFRKGTDGVLVREKSGHSNPESVPAVESFSFPELAPGTYAVRARTAGCRTAAADIDVAAGSATLVALDLGDRGCELVAVLPHGSTLPESLDVTARGLGAGVRGDFQRVSARSSDPEVRIGGLGPGRYLVEFAENRVATHIEGVAIVVDVPDAPLFRVELPPPPPKLTTDSRVRVHARRRAISGLGVTIAWIPGRVTALEPGVWIRFDRGAFANFRAVPGTYTAAVIDGDAVRMHTVELAAGETWTVEVPLD